MGKASKWIINFLLGRKEEKERKKENASFEEIQETSSGFWPSTPIIKRRWSFGRSSSKRKAHTRTKSFDLIKTNPAVKQAILHLQNQQNHIDSMALAANTATARTVRKSKPATYRISREVADAAATKIQAVFRSFLARKALGALRGLVKLQALVRGHQVRKKIAATLRQMHALMAIQVRARFQRIQMAEESQLVGKTQSSRYGKFTPENEFRRAHREAIDTNIYETREVSKSKYGYLNHSQIDRIEHGATRYFSRQLSISRQEHHQYEEFSFSTAQNTPRHHRVTCNTIPGRASFSNWQPGYTRPGSHDFSFQPNYMAKTESSRAKARSQSEPKQRPERNVRAESKRKASLDGTTSVLANAQSQCSSPHSKHITNENQDPAFIRLYQKRSVVKDEDSDAYSTITSRSSYCNSLLASEQFILLALWHQGCNEEHMTNKDLKLQEKNKHR